MHNLCLSCLRKWLPFLYVAMSAIWLAGCSNETESVTATPSVPQSEPKVEQHYNIALVMKTLTNPFFVEMEKGARLAEKELGINLIVKTAAQETSIQQQIGIVEELIRKKVNAIVIAPGDSVELIPILKQAQDAGIVVINIDNRLDPAYSQVVGLSGVPFISVDNEQAAYFVTRTLTSRMTAPTSVAILEGIREAENSEQRKNGALRAFNNQPLASVVAIETAHWKIDEGYEATKKLFDQYPDIQAIFCANDMMALGAIKYLQTTERTNVLVAGYDALEQAKDAIKAGTMLATVDQQAAEQGYQGVLFAYRSLIGERLPSVILIDTKVLTIENVQ